MNQAIPRAGRLLAVMLLLTLAGCASLGFSPKEQGDPGLCRENGWTFRPFVNETSAPRREDTVSDFSVPLTTGRWTLSEQWSGCESYVFVAERSVLSAADSRSLWESPDDIAELISLSPKNTHYFFYSTSEDRAYVRDNAEDMRARIDTVLAQLAPEDAEWWYDRIHVVDAVLADLQPELEQLIQGVSPLGFAVDRFQKVRALGLLSDVGRYSEEWAQAKAWPWEDNLAWLAHEAIYFNFESERQARLDAEDGVTIVRAWQDEVLQETRETVVKFPDAGQMSRFDTLEIDLHANCPEEGVPEIRNCGAWDYLSHLHLWDEASEQWLEIGRWITPYARAGRWLVDATPALALLQSGGEKRIRYTFRQAVNTRLEFRLRNAGLGYRPVKLIPLFAGGTFSSAYNIEREPISVDIPPTASRVSLWSLITGHGHSNTTSNCAEFCNHQHVFSIGENRYTKAHPKAGSAEGCRTTVNSGTVPNQLGTWFFGRGGWCPGRQVDPWVVDVTADVNPGAPVTISYQALVDGDTPPEGAGKIEMNSWLVIFEEAHR